VSEYLAFVLEEDEATVRFPLIHIGCPISYLRNKPDCYRDDIWAVLKVGYRFRD
jgi:hypothetical protein